MPINIQTKPRNQPGESEKAWCTCGGQLTATYQPDATTFTCDNCGSSVTHTEDGGIRWH